MTLILRSINDPHSRRIMTGVISLRRIMTPVIILWGHYSSLHRLKGGLKVALL